MANVLILVSQLSLNIVELHTSLTLPSGLGVTRTSRGSTGRVLRSSLCIAPKDTSTTGRRWVQRIIQSKHVAGKALKPDKNMLVAPQWVDSRVELVHFYLALASYDSKPTSKTLLETNVNAGAITPDLTVPLPPTTLHPGLETH